MAIREATFRPERLSVAVRSMKYDAGVSITGHARAVFGAPSALDADGIIAAGTSIASAIDVTSFAATYASTDAVMGPYGRNVTFILSGAGTPAFVVYGRDYLGQRMRENMTGNGAATVSGLKAFKYVDRITCGAVGGTTISVGWGNVFGLPYKFRALLMEIKNGVVAANAGTLVAGLATGTAATATNADVRGTYLPVTVLPDGTNTFEIIYEADQDNLHGNAQFWS